MKPRKRRRHIRCIVLRQMLTHINRLEIAHVWFKDVIKMYTQTTTIICVISLAKPYPLFAKIAILDNLPATVIFVRRAGLLLSQQDFEWRWSVPLFKCLTVLEFSFILFDLCLLITFFNFIMNYVPIVTFWIFTYHKIWILSIMFCFIWSYWIIYFLACLEVSWRVVS